ncbi:MAG: putative acetyltransferase [Syntrophorhabdaceae bacterium PtaU1.Bin034]|nr:MAG: putative acetyltransferase [Syntrophorhabdaceae bacterium PtaU1.Bin034]
MVKSLFVAILRGFGFVLAIIPAITIKLEAALGSSEIVYVFWMQCFAIIPGRPGSVIRSVFFHMVLSHCSMTADIWPYVSIGHRQTSIGSRVIITSFASVGRCTIGDDTGLGSGCHIISGKMTHAITPRGVDFSVRLQESSITIGKRVWIGDGAVIMADVGDGAIVGAGSVVTKPVPAYTVAVGNPAKVVKSLKQQEIVEPKVSSK